MGVMVSTYSQVEHSGIYICGTCQDDQEPLYRGEEAPRCPNCKRPVTWWFHHRLAKQPIGWEPDLNDGVRLNIRPFVTAGVLRTRFSVNWRKDRGMNADGTERHNDLHFTRAEKEAEADWLIARAAESVYAGPMLGELLRGDDLAARIGEPSPTLARGTTLRRGAGR